MEKEEKHHNLHYRILIIAAIAWLLHYWFLDEPTIGGNGNYARYIFWLPLIGGLIIIGIYRRKFLIKEITNAENALTKLVYIGSFFLQGLLFSFLIFGSLANGIWNQWNQRAAFSNRHEYIRCEVSEFQDVKQGEDLIWFYFEGKKESVEVSHATIKKYTGKNPGDYTLILRAREGVWGYYIVEDWEIL